MITAVELTHRFKEHMALRSVSFRVAKGEFVFLTGRSGAGKTTLLRLLHGDIPVRAGMARVAGHDLRTLPSARLPFLRRDVAVIFQDFKILPQRTVTDNVRLPLEVRGLPWEAIARRVQSVLALLGIGHLAELPCAVLSGGEQQRVAIARAMVGGPKIILADEPTGNLDWEMASRLMDTFKQFHAHGVTILMATHNLEIVRSMPQARVLNLEAGVLSSAGGPSETPPGNVQAANGQSGRTTGNGTQEDNGHSAAPAGSGGRA